MALETPDRVKFSDGRDRGGGDTQRTILQVEHQSVHLRVDYGLVIAGSSEGSYLADLQKPWRRVRKAAGHEDVRIHDLRHSFGSEAVMGGESLPMVGRILGHTQAETMARYAQLADEPLRRASDRIASPLKQAMDG